MSFRTRLVAAFLVIALVPLVALGIVVRRETTERTTAQYERRVAAAMDGIGADLATETRAVHAALAQVREAVMRDNRFRRGAIEGTVDDRRYLLDYGASAMRIAGLSMLQIQDETGRILTSGHFRNDFDRIDPGFPRRLAAAPDGIAIVRVRTPGASLVALAGVDSLSFGNRRLHIIGGLEAQQRFLGRLASSGDVRVALILPDDSLAVAAASPEIVRESRVPFVDSETASGGTALFRVSHPLSELHELRRSIDRWLLIAVSVVGALATLAALWLSARLSAPVVDLASRAARIDLDTLDVDFDMHRRDEIGALARGLGEMTARLREGAVLLKDAERRATMGEVARQVNHDLKNGLTPIRNVVRHLAEQADLEPARLPEVFRERRQTLDSSISYLENLAGSYARLSRTGERVRTDVNDVARRVVASFQGMDGATLRLHAQGSVFVFGDPVAIRRVIENLVDNAIDSLEGRAGEVTITSEVVGEADSPRVRLAVSDTGTGISAGERSRIFDDFYTTKAGGSGLGLTIVRRLVTDLNGTIAVESEPSRGSRFIVEWPAAMPAVEGTS